MSELNDENVNQNEEENNNENDVKKHAPENKLIDIQKELKKCNDKYLRKVAEFDNYRKRTENEKLHLILHANENLILELLPVLDDFDRMNSVWDEKHDIETLKQGSDLILEKLRKILNRHGLKQIDAIGEKFDFNLHDAVMQMARPDIEPDTIITEVEKGYYLNDKVIRHSKVVVSSGATGD